MLDYLALYRRFTAIAAHNQWQSLHSPRNLAQAVMLESAELVAEMQWMTDEQSTRLAPEQKARVAAELADVMLYSIALSQSLGLDLDNVLTSKMEANERRYGPQ